MIDTVHGEGGKGGRGEEGGGRKKEREGRRTGKEKEGDRGEGNGKSEKWFRWKSKKVKGRRRERED